MTTKAIRNANAILNADLTLPKRVLALRKILARPKLADREERALRFMIGELDSKLPTTAAQREAPPDDRE
jgi:hypothetical protein